MAHDSIAFGRLWLLRLLIVAGLAVLLVRLWRVQILEGSDYRSLADRNRLRQVQVAAPRGVIYDRNGEILVRNRPSFTVDVVPADLPKNSAGELDVVAQSGVLDQLMALLPTPEAPMPTATAPAAPPSASATPLAASAIPERKAWVMPRPTLETAIEQGDWGGAYKPITVAKYIAPEVAFQVAEKSYHLPGVDVVPVPIRDYVHGALTSQIMGYMGAVPEAQAPDYAAKGYAAVDQVGLAGIESSYEAELHGQSGQQTIEVDVNGRKVRVVGETNAPLPGHNLVLGLDLRLQKVATQALQAALDQSSGWTKATQGAVVAIDPRNGQIRALVSLPSYDNNIFAKGVTSDAWDALLQDPGLPMYNKAISGEYPPGSTFKLVLASGGLQDGIIGANTLLGEGVDGRRDGTLSLGNATFYCWIRNYNTYHGMIAVREAIARSCDIYFYELGGGYPNLTPGLGVNRVAYYARQFGFGALTGIELEGERAGFVPDERYKRLTFQELWTVGDTYNMSIGQGFVLSTPLQVANYTAAVASHGDLFQPQLVERITDAEGKTVRVVEPKLIRKVPVDPAYLDIVREGMYGVVNWPGVGTATSIKLPGVNVAGKTGTAEYFRDLDKDGKEDRDPKGNLPTHAWFTAFAPYENPELVVTVLVVNGGEGSQIAAPIAAKVLRKYFGIPEPAPPTPAATATKQP